MSFLDGLGLLGDVAPRLAGAIVVAFMLLWAVNPELGERLFMAVVHQAAQQASDMALKAIAG